MNESQNRSGQLITLILSSADGSENDGVVLDRELWNAIVPIALSESPGRLAEFVSLDFGPDETDAISLEADEHAQSLFWLAVVVECCGFSPVVARIADCWMHIPLDRRASWSVHANSDKPIHAQVLATKFPASPTFGDKVPAWLPRLIDAGTSGSVTIASHDLHWAYACSPLGESCIAFLDDESDNQEACLAISSCPVSCGAADGSMQGPALEAIYRLIGYLEMVEADREVSERVGWDVSAHELIAISAILQEWRERLQERD